MRLLALVGSLASVALAMSPALAADTADTGHTNAATPPPRIEVAFALDATGSMGPYIAQARERIRAIAADLAAGDPKPDVRFGLVAYRDKGDEYVTKVHPFTRDIDAMRRALDATEAGGGGDTPESVLEGVRDAVTALAWSPPEDTSVVRLVYVVGDAPPHEYPDSPKEAWITAEARRRRIAIHGIVCGSAGATVEPAFDAFARHTEGRVLHLDEDARRAGGAGGGGTGAPSSLAAALTDTTKAYSGSIGVRFDGAAATPVSTEPLAVPAIATSGLVGAHARWVRDAATWSDVWAIHTSLVAAAARPPAPSVDFARYEVLVLGGDDASLDLEAVLVDHGKRAARVRPSESHGVRFVLVPSANHAEGK
jgi:hypothetical protein